MRGRALMARVVWRASVMWRAGVALSPLSRCVRNGSDRAVVVARLFGAGKHPYAEPLTRTRLHAIVYDTAEGSRALPDTECLLAPGGLRARWLRGQASGARNLGLVTAAKSGSLQRLTPVLETHPARANYAHTREAAHIRETESSVQKNVSPDARHGR
jgi:hypothetical protein